MLTLKNISSLFGIIIIVLLFFSLVSYHTYDPSFLCYVSQQSIVKNWCGPYGAHIAALFFYIGGNASFVFLGALILIFYIIITKKSFKNEWDRLGAIGIIGFVGALYCTLKGKDGGYIGMFMHEALLHVVDDVLIAMLVYSLFSICCIIILRSFFFVVLSVFYQQIAVVLQPKCFVVIYRFIYKSILYIKRGFSYIINTLSGSSLPDFDQSMLTFEYDFPQEDEQRFENERKEVIKLIKQRTLFPLSGTTSSKEKSDPVSETLVSMISPQVIEKNSTVFLQEQQQTSAPVSPYHVPSDLLAIHEKDKSDIASRNHQLENDARILQEKLQRFGITGKVTSIKQGSIVTLFEYQPEINAKISKIISLEDDLGMALQAHSIRIIAPIPGRSVVGFEVSNAQRGKVHFAHIIRSATYRNFSGLLPLVLGESAAGDNRIADLAGMPHVLVAGSTGSGKSVCLNTMLMSLLYKQSPDKLKLILIDPKRLEFTPYIDIPHLLFPIITQSPQATVVLRWVIQEMERRYQVLASRGVRNIYDYQQLSHSAVEKMPFIVIVIDEFADLVMTSQGQVEDFIIRIAQMARAAGIHLILATQRPSADVITGLIKVNIPSRISFRVSSKIDSRIILDNAGAEKLLGHGDMLFLDPYTARIDRIHGAYISDQEILQITNHIRSQQQVQYHNLDLTVHSNDQDLYDHDQRLYQEILEFVRTVDEVSISLLQRKFKIGYNRSARIIDMLESQGVITSLQGSKVRKVIR